ncbi:GNAT family N-acetyltransferase [Neogemmobacter tilapiae]|uniref:Siderophore biosynthesis protein n=1 Tax=Neogemmobacter tilapiae TaxID=875041 RepID=A0A918WQ25_9RHOB|nr:GNAT family N-acetyltransferase [Gemmobacter tilapiae]GHC65370.1 siderophore biosynthesis protein [Gemmobacter tilapiae]
MPRDLLSGEILALRSGDAVAFGDGVFVALRDQGEGRLDLSAPPALSIAQALAAFEALTAQGGEVALRLVGSEWAGLLPDLRRMGAVLDGPDGVLVLPAALWQVPDRWLPQALTGFPTIWQSGPHGRFPLRPPKPEGVIYRRHIPWLDQWLSFRALTLDDLPTFHRWQNDPRVAAFFEESGTLEEHRAYLQRLLDDPHMFPVIAALNGRDFAYFELYWARENRIGAHCDADPWDRGWHVLVGEEDIRGADYVTAWLPSLMHYMFLAEPRTQAILGEPKASHVQQLKNLGRGGFAHVRDFDFAHKRASLVRLERQHFFESRLWARPETGGGSPLRLSPARLLSQGVWTS